jgi:hypothetical protein
MCSARLYTVIWSICGYLSDECLRLGYHDPFHGTKKTYDESADGAPLVCCEREVLHTSPPTLPQMVI